MFQCVFFAYIVSKLFKLNFFYYPNHYVTLDSNKTDQKTHWQQLLNFLIEDSSHLDYQDPTIVIDYKSLEINLDLNKPYIINIDFQTAHGIVADNYENYLSEHHGDILTRFHARNLYTPDVLKLSPSDFNITIHLPTLRGLTAESEEDIQKSLPSRMPWQYFDCNYNNLDQNTEYYTNLYSKLLIKLIQTAERNVNKNIFVNLISIGNPKVFERLVQEVSQHANIRLLLDIETPEAFFYFTKSNFLVQSHSSLSWLAGFFCQGIPFIRFPFRQQLSPNAYYFNDELQFFKLRQF